MSVYDAWQTTFQFSMTSNYVSGANLPVHLDSGLDLPKILEKARIQAEASFTQKLQDYFATTISSNNSTNPPPLGANDWQTVWGPQVFVVGPVLGSVNWITRTAKFNATNAMAVVFSPSLKRYIIAIAATNYVSIYDWLIEDVAVNTVVAWEGALQAWAGKKNTVIPKSSIPCISTGTYTGITNLLGMIDTVITKQSLMDFLNSIKESGCTLTFTGHSLAGALSPTLAMAAFDPTAGLLKNPNITVGQAQCYPTAGATPGNKPLADLFNNTKFAGGNGTQPWQMWNTDLYNNLDIVPRAWVARNMKALPTIYSAYYDKATVLAMTGLVDSAVAFAVSGELIAGQYTSINRAALNGETTADAANEFVYQYDITVQGSPMTELMTLPQAAQSPYHPTNKTNVNLGKQLLFQHTTAYGQLILGHQPTPS